MTVISFAALASVVGLDWSSRRIMAYYTNNGGDSDLHARAMDEGVGKYLSHQSRRTLKTCAGEMLYVAQSEEDGDLTFVFMLCVPSDDVISEAVERESMKLATDAFHVYRVLQIDASLLRHEQAIVNHAKPIGDADMTHAHVAASRQLFRGHQQVLHNMLEDRCLNMMGKANAATHIMDGGHAHRSPSSSSMSVGCLASLWQVFGAKPDTHAANDHTHADSHWQKCTTLEMALLGAQWGRAWSLSKAAVTELGGASAMHIAAALHLSDAVKELPDIGGAPPLDRNAHTPYHAAAMWSKHGQNVQYDESSVAVVQALTKRYPHLPTAVCGCGVAGRDTLTILHKHPQPKTDADTDADTTDRPQLPEGQSDDRRPLQQIDRQNSF